MMRPPLSGFMFSKITLIHISGSEPDPGTRSNLAFCERSEYIIYQSLDSLHLDHPS
jgi:hypothetical protein